MDVAGGVWRPVDEKESISILSHLLYTWIDILPSPVILDTCLDLLRVITAGDFFHLVSLMVSTLVYLLSLMEESVLRDGTPGTGLNLVAAGEEGISRKVSAITEETVPRHRAALRFGVIRGERLSSGHPYLRPCTRRKTGIQGIFSPRTWWNLFQETVSMENRFLGVGLTGRVAETLPPSPVQRLAPINVCRRTPVLFILRPRKTLPCRSQSSGEGTAPRRSTKRQRP
jgi:hypothetical protein